MTLWPMLRRLTDALAGRSTEDAKPHLDAAGWTTGQPEGAGPTAHRMTADRQNRLYGGGQR